MCFYLQMLSNTNNNATFAAIQSYRKTTKTMEKTIRKFASYLMMVMMAFAVTSCNEDDDIAYTLDGIWEGEVATEYFNYRWGYQTEYQYVDIEFFADPYRYARGTGVERDYSPSGRRYVECFFDFEVHNGVIYIDYDDGSSVAIYNYRLSNNHFYGDFHDDYTGKFLASFDFVKVNNWRHNRYYRSSEQEWTKVPSPLLQK